MKLLITRWIISCNPCMILKKQKKTKKTRKFSSIREDRHFYRRYLKEFTSKLFRWINSSVVPLTIPCPINVVTSRFTQDIKETRVFDEAPSCTLHHLAFLSLWRLHVKCYASATLTEDAEILFTNHKSKAVQILRPTVGCCCCCWWVPRRRPNTSWRT